MNEAEGSEFIPLGKPLTDMFTCPVKPFSASTETVTGEVVPPTCVETEVVESPTLKSGDSGGELYLPHKKPMLVPSSMQVQPGRTRDAPNQPVRAAAERSCPRDFRRGTAQRGSSLSDESRLCAERTVGLRSFPWFS